MFTGIITKTGTVIEAAPSRVAVRAERNTVRKLPIGGSVALDGVCLTVVSKKRDMFAADIMQETARKTTIGEMAHGHIVNLELPATPASFLSGHIVQGHVDGIGVVKKITAAKNRRIIEVAFPASLARYVASKGSIALNGVSLTIISIRSNRFIVGIIPHTWKATALFTLKLGSRVNIETDVLAKYVERLSARKKFLS